MALQALFVTFLWSTSWVLIKFGLEEIPPLTFAGLRYMLAFLVLAPLLWRPFLWRQPVGVVAGKRPSPFPTAITALTKTDWLRLILLGIIFYAITQGAQFVALAYAPAVSVTLIWSFTAVAVAVLGIVTLGERPNGAQWAGMLLALAGAVVYFYPFGLAEAQFIGLLAALVGMLSNSVAAVLGREFEVRILSQVLRADVLPDVKAAEQEQIWAALSELRYIFRHTLLRDAAYEMQLRTRLRELHRLAAAAYEQLHAADLTTYYPELAYHYGQAHLPEQERQYALKAAEQAAAQYANQEAIHYFSRVLELTPPDDGITIHTLLMQRVQLYDRVGDREGQWQDISHLLALTQSGTDETSVRHQVEARLLELAYIRLTKNYAAAAERLTSLVDRLALADMPDLAGRTYTEWGEILLRQGQHAAAKENSLSLREGVYVWVTGPTLETRAEYRMLRNMGADVVGMSTVPEVIAARHLGMRVVAFSIVTDLCIPETLEEADIETIIKTAGEAEPKLTSIVKTLVTGL